MIKIFQRDGGNRTVGSKPYRFQVLAQVVGSGCWLLPKPMYNVTDKQVDHSPSSVFFFNFSFSPFNGAVAGITERSMVSLNDPTGICPTIPSIRTLHLMGHPPPIQCMIGSLPTKAKTWNLQFHALPFLITVSLDKWVSLLPRTKSTTNFLILAQ
ncbi:hypothetical protein VNO78_23779 [Psophocarpus tetragonolobus]|uniref:Uncharacterized protein n=1 Tax=Psophocarpus tetragonolobus TaxID=3891 RepID=A0AAN9XE43_PSOTE